MSEKEESSDSNNNNEKIKIYDNDDAYLFGDASLEESNEDEDKNDNYNQNENNINSPQSSSNKNINNEKFEESEKNNIIYDDDLYAEDKDKNSLKVYNNYQNNNYNKNDYLDNQINEDNNCDSQEINSKEDSLINEKFIINDITTDKENDQEYEERENNDKYKENKIKNNDEQQQKNVENNVTNENENESNESEVPLITLNFLSICQCCKNQFNSKNNIPYLFKCGHFFCKQCIEEQFTDEEGIKCPNDGIIGKYLSELKILNNFITDKPTSQRTKSNKKYCEYHKGQNLTHYIEDTKELICVYCAFERYKSNPGIEIKDINEKCKSMENKIDGIIDYNQHNIEIIQNSLRDIRNNKEMEEKKIDEVFNGLFEILKIKREALLSKIEEIFTKNAKKLSDKLELFSKKLEKSEKIKNKIIFFENNNNRDEISFFQIINIYDSFIKEISDIQKTTLQKYKFIYEEEMKLKEILNEFGTLELKEKSINFFDNNLQIKTEEEGIINNNNNELSQNRQIKFNKEKSIKKTDSYKIDNFYHFINKEIKKDSSCLSNKRNKVNKDNKNMNSIKQNSKNKNIERNNEYIKVNPNKSSGDIKNSGGNQNKKKNIIKKLTKNSLNNKSGVLSEGTTPAYLDSSSKIDNHGLEGINKAKKVTPKFKYNLSLGQNNFSNNISCINPINSDKKLNRIKNNSKIKNIKSKNNKSITTPGRTIFKADNKCKK